MFKPTQFLDQTAFFIGFKAFKQGKLNPPKFMDYSLKEWHRGQNYAYFQCLERTKQRERYRRNFTGINIK